MDLGSLVGLIIPAVIVLVILKIFFKGTKLVLGFLINVLIGAVALWVLGILGVGIQITWLTAAIVGFLGFPGVIILLILKFVLHII